MSYKDRISIDPAVCHARACITGTRVMVSVILDNLAAGKSEAKILDDYPSLSAPDVRAALEYASAQAKEEVVPLAE